MRLTAADRAAWARYEHQSRAAADQYNRQPNSFPTDDAAREAHVAYNRGDRTPEVVDGERRYQRDRKRGQRRTA
jgi:hypothetical protein